jgi:hypothetical protein
MENISSRTEGKAFLNVGFPIKTQGCALINLTDIEDASMLPAAAQGKMPGL